MQPVRIDKQPISLIELVTAFLASVAIPENIDINVHMKADFPQVKADPPTPEEGSSQPSNKRGASHAGWWKINYKRGS